MADIKLIALDLDGTLLNSDKKISERNLAALKAAQDKGVKVVLTTGRPLKAMDFFLHELGTDGREDEYTDITNELSITPKGAIDISVSSWSSMGTAATGGSTYRYRFQSGDFYLIGEESTWGNRLAAEWERTSINYLSGQKEVTSGDLITRRNLKTKQIKIKKEPLRLLGSFQM